MKLGAMDTESLGALGPHNEGCSAKKSQPGQRECGLHSADAGVSQSRAAGSLGLRSRRLVGDRRNCRLLYSPDHRSLLHRGSWLSWSWLQRAATSSGAGSTSPSKQEGEARQQPAVTAAERSGNQSAAGPGSTTEVVAAGVTGAVSAAALAAATA